jgi:hypothetical protein
LSLRAGTAILCSVFRAVSILVSSASAGALTPALLDGARL